MAIYYILNLSICEFSLANSEQGLNMYNSFLGDLKTIDNYVQKIDRHELHKDDQFYLTSLYLTYFTNYNLELGDLAGRNNKVVIKNIFATINALIEKNAPSNKIYFVCFIHSHGAPNMNQSEVNIKVDNYPNQINVTNNSNNFFTMKELVNFFVPALEFADCYLILNSCYTSEKNISENKSFKQEYKNYSDYGITVSEKSKALFCLSMSSERVWSNKYDDNSYGIKVLNSIFEMGIEFSIHRILEIYIEIISKFSIKKAYSPILTIFGSEKQEDEEEEKYIKHFLESTKPTREYIVINEDGFMINHTNQTDQLVSSAKFFKPKIKSQNKIKLPKA